MQKIYLTIGEMGLEERALAVWAEPRAGQLLKPRFGARTWSKKPLLATLIVGVLSTFVAVSGDGRVPGLWLGVGSVLAITIAWPLMMALDRLRKRNVWVYSDKILISHGQDRAVLKKSDLMQIHVYAAKGAGAMQVMEFLTTKEKSTVVGVPGDVALGELLSVLRAIGYAVSDELSIGGCHVHH